MKNNNTQTYLTTATPRYCIIVLFLLFFSTLIVSCSNRSLPDPKLLKVESSAKKLILSKYLPTAYQKRALIELDNIIKSEIPDTDKIDMIKELTYEKHYPIIIKSYRKAAEDNDIKAQYLLARCYFNGYGVEKNLPEALKWYKKAADKNYPRAQFVLGECYYKGYGVSQNIDQAVKLYQKAAEQGDEDALKRLKDLRIPPNNMSL